MKIPSCSEAGPDINKRMKCVDRQKKGIEKDRVIDIKSSGQTLSKIGQTLGIQRNASFSGNQARTGFGQSKDKRTNKAT